MEKRTIKFWAQDDRPRRKKLLAKGKSSLSNAELIAILIGSGNKMKALLTCQKKDSTICGQQYSSSLPNYLLRSLMSFHGIGEAKAISILTALELGREDSMSLVLKCKKFLLVRMFYTNEAHFFRQES